MNAPEFVAKDAAMVALRHAIDGLRPHLTSPNERGALFQIEEALDRLRDLEGAPALGMKDFDGARLSHLLDITGPNLAVELLARLTEDLTNTRDILAQGSANADWKRLREGSHVLISLAGSVGALSLQTMAETLNALAHRQDREALATLMPPLDGELQSLIALIRATRPPAR